MKKLLIVLLIVASVTFAKPTTNWEGVAKCIITYLDNNLKDPDSLDIRSCSKIISENGAYYQRVNYTAKNSFGGRIRSNKVFIIKQHGYNYTVTGHYDFKL